jgi:hypothetical protein
VEPVAPQSAEMPNLQPARAPAGRRWPWALAVCALVLALVAGGTVTWLVTDQLGAGRDDDPTSRASAARSPETDGASERHDAATSLLAARSRAILDRDKAAFLGLIDPAATRFRARQATVFDRLSKVPFAEWEYEFEGEGPELRDDQAERLPAGAFIARVLVRYTFEGTDSPVEREQFLTLVPREGDWLLATDEYTGAGAPSPDFGRDIWELGPVTVVRGHSSLVIGEAKASALRPFAREADRSVRDVRAVWKGAWSQRPVVIVPRTQADMALIVGTSAKGLEQIAAVTTGYSASGPTRGDRVVINPRAWRSLKPLGRRVVMSHEVTHLATRAVTYSSVPIWMSEGFADYVAYEAVDLPTRVIAAHVLDLVRAGKGPAHLPGDTDFDAGHGDVAPAYESSWLATRLIADRYGERKLVRLYVSLADRDNGPADDDIRAVLGISEKKLIKDWRAYLKSLAR